MAQLAIIVAHAQNGTIGLAGNMPWRLPEDLKHFKEVTMGHPVIMGRVTHESIGRPLPGRDNIVISRNPDYRPEGCRTATSLEEAAGMIKNDELAFVLGGAQSPTISDNCADILLAFEPMEAVRALSKANADTIVITNTAPVVPFIPGGSAAYPPVDELLACLRAKVGRVIAFDARKESLEAGNPLGLNMVMLGALYGAADMPLTKESQMEAIRKNGKPAFVESNLNCFERGFKAASEETAKD